jgi:WASH complex subunit strumpellin
VLIIKDGDIYDTARNYVRPEHRSFALADQASLLYVLMFFIPDFLREESAKMREIVDKHFYDNWVVPIFLGYLVDTRQLLEQLKTQFSPKV